MKRGILVLSLLAAPSVHSHAQDIFEIQVYEYLTVPKGRWNLETHFNHSARGIRETAGPMLPTHGQTRLTLELTHGITPHFELAGYLAFARQSGDGPRFAAWRVRPRIRAPEEWNLPVGLSLSAEVAFPRDRYDSEKATLEIRPIIERSIGPVQINLNPVVGRSLKGPGTEEGWDFEPGGRLAVGVHPKVKLSVEYYGSYGTLSDFLPREEQVHIFFTGGDLRLRENIVLNLGLGLGATSAGERTVLKSRFGWMF